MKEINRVRHLDRMARYNHRLRDERHGLQVDHQRARAVAVEQEAEPEDADPLVSVLRSEKAEVLDQAMRRRLTARDRSILRRRFGLDDGVSRTLKQTGELWGLSRERVRQIIHRAIRRLKHFERHALGDEP